MPESPQILYLTLNTPLSPPWQGGVYRSDDGGRTWVARNNGLQQTLGSTAALSSNYRELAIHPDNPDVVYAGSTDYVTTTLYKTTDGGRMWVPIIRKPPGATVEPGWADFVGHTVQCMTMSPRNPSLLYWATSMTVYRTRDAGATWEQAYTQVNADGSVETTGLEITAVRFVSVDPGNRNRVFYGYSDVGLFISENGGGGGYLLDSGWTPGTPTSCGLRSAQPGPP